MKKSYYFLINILFILLLLASSCQKDRHTDTGPSSSAIAAPVLNPPAGTYYYPQDITISCATAEVFIYYTSNGSDPDTSSFLYQPGDVIPVVYNTCLKATAFRAGLSDSPVTSASYFIDSTSGSNGSSNINYLKVQKPSFSIPPGFYSVTTNVYLNCATSGAAVYYTTNGSDPDTNSLLYSGSQGITITVSTVIKAVAVKQDWINSDVLSGTFHFRWPPDPGNGITSNQIFSLALDIDDSDNIYLAYSDVNNEGNVIKYNGTSWSYVGQPAFTPYKTPQLDIQIDSSGIPWVAMDENLTDPLGVSDHTWAGVMKYDGSWQRVGAESNSAGSAYFITIAFDNTDTPYIGYCDHRTPPSAAPHYYQYPAVKKFTGSWSGVGMAGGYIVDTASASSFNMAVNSSGTPYISFYSNAFANQLEPVVMVFNGSDWEYTGANELSQEMVDATALAIDNNDTLYLAVLDRNSGSRVTVFRYNGSSWELSGSRAFSADQAANLVLAIDNNNTPYVAYQDYQFDGINGKKATVKKFNGSDWETVGPPGCTPNMASYIDLAFDSQNRPYLAFKDWGNAGEANVLQYNGSDWVQVK